MHAVRRTTLPHLHYELVLSYLYTLYIKIREEKYLKVTELIEYPSYNNGTCHNADFAFDDVAKLYTPGLGSVTGIIKYFNEEYVLTASIMQDRFKENNEIVPSFSLVAKKESYQNTGKVFEYILEQSIAHSHLRKAAVAVRGLDPLDALHLEELQFNNEDKVETFLPRHKKEQFLRFQKAILNEHRPLRFLLSGKPGTGKTQIVNSILKSVHRNILILKLYNFEIPFSRVFEFIKIFDRCLLVIDDIDLFLKDRDMNFASDKLFEFLQFVDTNEQKKIFLLATTNDKKLVDMAASRPGRFDMIIDMDNIDIQNYLDLIKRETDRESILTCFDEELLKMMQSKQVTGAFIVNLVKQLEHDYIINETMNRDIVLKYFNLLYRGFYDSNSKKVGNSVGFY